MSQKPQPSTDSEAPPLLAAEDLVCRYGPHPALNGLSISLHRGCVTGLLGVNGAGKTTALHVLAGLRIPDGGQLYLEGSPIPPGTRALRAQIGLLPHRPPLHAELTVTQAIAHAARLAGVPRGAVAEAVARTRARCDLDDVAHRRAGNLSQGYRQRLGLAQAIVHDPAVILLDEPTVGLDPRQLVQLRGLIRELGREHAVLLSSHALGEVQEACDEVVVLHQGRAVYHGAHIEPGGDEDALLVRLTPVPGADELARLPGIAGVEALPAGRWRLRLAPEGRGPLLQALAAGNWRLEEWLPPRAGLERLFLDLTRGEEA